MIHNHDPSQRCDQCRDWPEYARLIVVQLATITDELTHIRDNQTRNARNVTRRLGEMMTQASDNQAHIEQDVSAIGASIATAVQELKAQIAAGTPAQALDFTSLDNLAASTAAEAAADAPPPPPAPPAPAAAAVDPSLAPAAVPADSTTLSGSTTDPTVP